VVVAVITLIAIVIVIAVAPGAPLVNAGDR
jgi:hypothetical protein